MDEEAEVNQPANGTGIKKNMVTKKIKPTMAPILSGLSNNDEKE